MDGVCGKGQLSRWSPGDPAVIPFWSCCRRALLLVVVPTGSQWEPAMQGTCVGVCEKQSGINWVHLENDIKWIKWMFKSKSICVPDCFQTVRRFVDWACSFQHWGFDHAEICSAFWSKIIYLVPLLPFFSLWCRGETKQSNVNLKFWVANLRASLATWAMLHLFLTGTVCKLKNYVCLSFE